jgi:hypothetical protein
VLAVTPANVIFNPIVRYHLKILSKCHIFWSNDVNNDIAMAKAVSLIHQRETVKVLARTLVVKCNRFADDPTLLTGPYALKSSVSVADLSQFVSAMEGDAVAITNENVKACLCSATSSVSRT